MADQNIQPAGRAGSGGGFPQGFTQGTYQGTVTSTRVENGVQTVEIHSSQGRIRMQAEGEFKVGDHIRLSIQPGSGMTLEKTLPPPQLPLSGDWLGVGYTLPQNLGALKDVRAFEEALAAWIAGRGPGSGPAPAGSPPGGGLAAQLPGEAAALLRLPLPELLKRLLVREGGRDFLAQVLPRLDAAAFAQLLAGLEEARSEPGLASLVELVKSLRGGSAPETRGAPGAADGQAAKAGALLLGGNAFAGQASLRAPATNPESYWQAEAGKGAAPWFGRVLERQEAGASFSAMNRLGGFAPPKESPLFRYLLDLGGGPGGARTLTAYSPQARLPGEFVDFELEKGPRLQARFLEPAEALPQRARAAFAGAPPELRPALQVAAHYLRDFAAEPYFGKLARDFAEVLAQSGRLDAPAPNAAAGAGAGAQAQAARMPEQKELDGLLRLFLAFPRDAAQPERQAKVWGEAVRNPQAFQELLRALQPDQETSLLRGGTRLALEAGAPRPPAPGQPAAPAPFPAPGAPVPGEDSLAHWLRKLLPETFKGEDMLQAARDAAAGAAKAPEGREAARFLMQAFSAAVPRENEMREGHPSQFYFYQSQEWRGLQVTWQREREAGQRQPGPKAPVQLRVETQGRHMGKVDVKVSLDDKGRAHLDFRNQFHDMREALAKEIPALEKNLSFLDFRVEAWTYEMMKDEAAPPIPGWTRPSGLDPSNLDLFG